MLFSAGAPHPSEGSSQVRRTGCYGLTGMSCKRLLEPSVAIIALTSAPLERAFHRPGGTSELRCGVPEAATAAVSGMTTAATAREAMAKCFRIAGPSFFGDLEGKSAHFARERSAASGAWDRLDAEQ